MLYTFACDSLRAHGSSHDVQYTHMNIQHRDMQISRCTTSSYTSLTECLQRTRGKYPHMLYQRDRIEIETKLVRVFVKFIIYPLQCPGQVLQPPPLNSVWSSTSHMHISVIGGLIKIIETYIVMHTNPVPAPNIFGRN